MANLAIIGTCWQCSCLIDENAAGTGAKRFCPGCAWKLAHPAPKTPDETPAELRIIVEIESPVGPRVQYRDDVAAEEIEAAVAERAGEAWTVGWCSEPVCTTPVGCDPIWWSAPLVLATGCSTCRGEGCPAITGEPMPGGCSDAELDRR